MRSLITGASGFLGGRLAQMLAGAVASFGGSQEIVVLARKTSDLRHLAGFPVQTVAVRQIAFDDRDRKSSQMPQVRGRPRTCGIWLDFRSRSSKAI